MSRNATENPGGMQENVEEFREAPDTPGRFSPFSGVLCRSWAFPGILRLFSRASSESSRKFFDMSGHSHPFPNIFRPSSMLPRNFLWPSSTFPNVPGHSWAFSDFFLRFPQPCLDMPGAPAHSRTCPGSPRHSSTFCDATGRFQTFPNLFSPRCPRVAFSAQTRLANGGQQNVRMGPTCFAKLAICASSLFFVIVCVFLFCCVLLSFRGNCFFADGPENSPELAQTRPTKLANYARLSGGRCGRCLSFLILSLSFYLSREIRFAASGRVRLCPGAPERRIPPNSCCRKCCRRNSACAALFLLRLLKTL